VLENRSERNRWISQFTQFSTLETFQPALVVGDVVAVFLGKRLIDAGLVNAGQQRLQRSSPRWKP